MKNFTLLLATFFIFSVGFAWSLSGSTSNWENKSIEEEKSQSELKVYPNPCKNNKVTVDFQASEISEIRISNIAGKEVLYKKLQFPANKETIQLENFQNGIYLVRIISVDNIKVVRKLIVSGN